MRLKLNCDQMETIMFGNQRQRGKCLTDKLELDGNLIPLSTNVWYLGGFLDTDLTLKKHVSTACSKAMANFIRIRDIRKFLNREACETLSLGLCISHLDYANAILYGLPDITINHLQRIQNVCQTYT